MDFSDDFNRGDGALGAAWVQIGGQLDVKSNECAPHSTVGTARPNQLFFSAHHRYEFDLGHAYTNGSHVTIKLRSDSLFQNCYQFQLTFNASSHGFALSKIVSNVATSLASGTWPVTPSAGARYVCQVAGSRLLILCNSQLVFTLLDTAIVAGAYHNIAIDQVGTYIDNFRARDVANAGFSVVPTTATDPGDPVPLTITGGSDTWVPGTPGSPVFTVDQGTLSDQTITTPSAATATYTPPLVDLIAVVTDPSSGATATIELATDLEAAGGGGGTDSFQAYAAAMTAEGLGPGSFADAIGQVLAWLLYPTPANQSGLGWLGADHDTWVFTDYLIRLMEQATGETVNLTQAPPEPGSGVSLYQAAKRAYDNAYDANGKLTYIIGDPNVSLPDILAAIQGVPDWLLPHGTSTPLVDWLTFLWHQFYWTDPVGGGLPLAPERSLRDVADSGAYNAELAATSAAAIRATDVPNLAAAIRAVRGPNGLPTIQQVLDAIGALQLQGTDLTPVLDAIAALRGDQAATVAAVLARANAIPTDPIRSLAPVTDLLNTIRGDNTTTLAAILAAIGAGATNPYVGPPVWPGLTGVNLGTSLPLTISTSISSTLMHGVLLDLTSLSEEKPTKSLAGIETSSYFGRYSFMSDNGYLEQWQGIPAKRAILTPRSMRVASGVALMFYAYPTGTVRPWSLAQ